MRSEAISQMNVLELYEKYSRSRDVSFSEEMKHQFYNIIEQLIVDNEASEPFCSYSVLKELKSKGEDNKEYVEYKAYYDRHSRDIQLVQSKKDFFEFKKDFYSYLQDIHIKSDAVSKDDYLMLIKVSLCLFNGEITHIKEWLEYHIEEVASYCKNDWFEAKRLIHASVLDVEEILPSTTIKSLERYLSFDFNPTTINDFVKANSMAKFNHMQKRLEEHHFIDSSRRWLRKKKELVCLLSILIELGWWYEIGSVVTLKDSGLYLSKHFSVSHHSMKDYYINRHLKDCLNRFRDHFKDVFSEHDWRLIKKL